jgi:phosphinothricin acetyltransferase
MRTRPAERRDAAAIARIYNDGIEERVATFETELRSASHIEGWLGNRYPVVVVEHEGEVVGFAAASPYSPRECYSGVAEFSVYVDRRARRKGAGSLAVDALAAACEAGGFWKLTGKIFAENQGSRDLVAGLGFREVGTHMRHSRLDGRWRDVVVVERLLAFGHGDGHETENQENQGQLT